MRPIARSSLRFCSGLHKAPSFRVARGYGNSVGLCRVEANEAESVFIYYWEPASQTFYMMYLYAKNEQGDLTAAQLKVLARIVREELT